MPNIVVQGEGRKSVIQHCLYTGLIASFYITLREITEISTTLNFKVLNVTTSVDHYYVWSLG
jgi:hypothetical protein